MKKTYIISFFIFLFLACCAYFGSYYAFHDQQEKEMAEQQEDTLETILLTRPSMFWKNIMPVLMSLPKKSLQCLPNMLDLPEPS